MKVRHADNGGVIGAREHVRLPGQDHTARAQRDGKVGLATPLEDIPQPGFPC
jgi:hypothetical protein